MQKPQFGNGGQGQNPNAFVRPKPKPPVVDNGAPQQQRPQNFDKPVNNQFGNQNKDRHKDKRPDQFGGGNPGGPNQPNFKPGNPGNPAARPAGNFAPPAGQPQSPAEAKRRFEALRGQRKEVKFDGGKGVVIEEPGKRRIFKDNNRVFIQHDDNERLRRVAPNARFEKGKGGTNIAVIDRPGGYKIYSETDANGQLIRRYRRGPDGRDFIIIDNRRRHRDNFGRDLAAGIGIGVGVVAGAAILNSVLDVPPPRVTIPRDEYIVDYERASDEDVYDALSAPPVDNFRDRYTLDEIRATAALRDRMRRVDLDDITFDFGSWEVTPSQYGKLDRIARAMKRIIDRHPDEVFMIEGYTDAVGTPEDNLSLSDRRAESVAEVLTDQFQIPFENLTTQGYGEEFLKVPTSAPERLNRRVAVRRITPLLARGQGAPPPPPSSGARQQNYDDGPGGPDDAGPDNGGPDNGGPDDDRGYDGPPPR
ncbi:MAG: OmpA family protein [Hyphomicrobium sp.]|uniref:OmpA family protein n=1 Tax=Hyphomicrobium sp. TaxID=82 RepID=UPI0039E53A19